MMGDSKKILIVISNEVHSRDKNKLYQHPLITLARYLVQEMFTVSVLICDSSVEITETDRNFLKNCKIVIYEPPSNFRQTNVWLNLQSNIFMELKFIEFDLIISDLQHGPLALYAGFDDNSKPVVTYLNSGIYFDKLQSNESFRSVPEIIVAALEDVQLKNSDIVISSSDYVSDIYTSLGTELRFLQLSPRIPILDFPEDQVDGLENGWGKEWKSTISNLLNKKTKLISTSEETLVSIVIATKNREIFLPNALKSCVMQTVMPIEIIVVDDGSDSPKAIEEIIKEFSELVEIKLIRNELSIGQAKSRNVGASTAQGNLIAFLDDDNYFLPNHLELCTNLLKNEEIDAACTFMNLVVSSQPIDQNSIADTFIIFAGDHFGALNHIYNLVMETSIVIRKVFFEKVGGFPDLMRSSAEDWGLGLKIMSSGGVIRSTGTPTVMYRWNNDGVLATVDGLAKWWPLQAGGNKVVMSDWWFQELARLLIHNNQPIVTSQISKKLRYIFLLIKRRDYMALTLIVKKVLSRASQRLRTKA
jgi:glycosyltransferase involved in cell wall biosynthesis